MKDEERYKAFCRAFPDFDKSFQEGCEEYWAATTLEFISVTNPEEAGIILYTILIPKDQVEAVPEYDPHKWNVWPGVEPPRGVLMRIEVYEKLDDNPGPEMRSPKLIHRTSSTWNGKYWTFPTSINNRKPSSQYFLKFRPWDDVEEEKDDRAQRLLEARR